MQSKTDLLLKEYERVIHEPWSKVLSGQERVWFLVYDPAEQRKINLRLDDFETATKKAGKKWQLISFKKCFPSWMANHEYRDDYFSDPEYIVDQLEASFIPFAIQYFKNALSQIEQDNETVIAVTDVSALFGFARLSEILKNCDKDFTDRLLVFFPGEFEHNQYRLLDARDGWDYLARPITV